MELKEVSLKFVTVVTSSVSGKFFATGDTNGVIRLWETTPFQSHDLKNADYASVTSLVFSGDEKRLVSYGSDLLLRIWDTETKKCLASMVNANHKVVISSVSFDGTRVIGISSDHRAYLWDTRVEESMPIVFPALGDRRIERAFFTSPDGAALLLLDADWNTCVGTVSTLYQSTLERLKKSIKGHEQSIERLTRSVELLLPECPPLKQPEKDN